MNNRTPDITDVLTAEEKNACKENFDLFDKDGDGCLDDRELKRYLEELGQHPSDEEIIKMIGEVDQSDRGCVNFEDFLRVMAMQKLATNNLDEYDTSKKLDFVDGIVDAFVAMGGKSDKNGEVDATKLIKIIKDEFKMTIDIERLIREIDEDNSGQIKYEEFKALLN